MKGAIFDLDGTLLDSMWVWREVDDSYIRGKGKIPEPDLSRKLAYKNMEQSVLYFKEQYSIADPPEQMAAELWGLARHAYYHLVPLKPHAFAFLAELSRRGIKSVVATAGDKAFSCAALKRCGVERYISGIVTCDELRTSKDRPDIFYAAQKLLDLPTEEIVVFEDSLHAVQTAKAASFTVAAVYDSFSAPDEQALKTTADYYLRSFLDWNFAQSGADCGR